MVISILDGSRLDSLSEKFIKDERRILSSYEVRVCALCAIQQGLAPGTFLALDSIVDNILSVVRLLTSGFGKTFCFGVVNLNNLCPSCLETYLDKSQAFLFSKTSVLCMSKN